MLYTEDDYKRQPNTTTGNYTIAKTISELATGEPSSGEVDFNETINKAWNAVAPEEQQADYEVVKQAAAKGDVPLAESAMTSMRDRDALRQVEQDDYDTIYKKAFEATNAVTEKIVTLSKNVVINNDPAKLAKNIQEAATNATSAALLEKDFKDSMKLSGFDIVKGIAGIISPLDIIAGRAHEQVAIENSSLTGITAEDVDFFTTRNEMNQMLRNKYQSLPPEERLPWIQQYNQKLEGRTDITNMQRVGILADIIGDEDITIGGVGDWIDRLAAPLFLAGAAGGVIRASKGIKAAASLDGLSKSIAKAGGKEALENAETAKALSKLATKERVKATALLASEATGVQSVLDLTKLASVSLARVLPDALTSPASDIQKAIRAKANNTIEQLQEVLAAKTINSDVVLTELDALRKSFSNVNNPNVFNADFRVSDDGLSIVGKVVYKPTEASRFTTEAAATEFNTKVLGGKGKVIPDTTNHGFLVEDDYVKALETEGASIVAKLGEMVSKGSKRPSKASKAGGEGVGSVAPVKPVVEAPSALKTSKPKYGLPNGAGNVELSFADDVDKAAYIVASKTKPTKSDAELTAWIKEVTGWSDAQIKAHGKLIRDNVKSATKSVDVVESGKYTVPKTSPELGPATKGGVVSGGSVIDDATAIHAFTKFNKDGEVVYSNNIPYTFLLPFIKNISKVLGMDKHRVAVLQLKDVVADKKLANLAQLYTSAGAGTGAMHVPTRYGSIIIMGADMPKMITNNATKVQAYLELFAHEYGHAFEFAFQFKYQDEIKALFTDWLRSKGIKTDFGALNQQLPLEALLEYRAITDADLNITKANLAAWVDKYFAGDTAAYLAKEKNIHEWLSSYHEFFAENFAKWSLTSDIPTTALGQAFAKIVEGIKTIAANVQQFLAKYGKDIRIGTAPQVEKFMNDHTKRVKAGLVATRELLPTVAMASKSMEPSVKALRKRLDEIQTELKAIRDAKEGAVHGFIVEQEIKSVITFDKAGTYTDADINSAVRNALGDWTLEAAEEAVKKRTVGVHAGSRYHKILTDFVRGPLEKLNKKEATLLDAALVRGDAEGEVFSENMLAGMGLSKRAQEAYYTVRAARDIMHMVKNDTLSKVLTRKGYVDLGVRIEGVDEQLFGKMLNPSEAMGRVARDISDHKNVVVTDTWNEKRGELLLYELVRPVKIDGKHYKTIAVKAGEVKPKQITTALPYRKGEYSRLYTDQYWVKVDATFDIDGVSTAERIAHRTAAQSGDAKAYADAFNEAVDLWKAGKLTAVTGSKLEAYGVDVAKFIDDLNANRYGNNPKANVYYNRADEDFINNDVAMGGIMGSHRGEHIPNVFGRTNTESPLDSIAAEIGNTAQIASTLEWREAQVIKWFNTFRDDLPVQMQHMRPEQALAAILNSSLDSTAPHRKAIAYNTAKYLESQLNIMTKEEQMWLGFSKRMSEWIEGANSPALNKVGALMRENSDLTVGVRALTFHSYMGAFNLKHVFMQAMNAFNAVVISPVHGLPAAKTSVLLGSALITNSDDAIRAFAKMNNITNLGLGMDETEFLLTVKALRRTGLIDGIGHNTVWGAEGGKFGIFNGLTRGIGKASALPFNTGEGYARIVSFDIARREFKAANPGQPWWTDDALEKIIARQDDLTQNMTAANRANWQKGIASVPTQFMQYFVKMLMNIGQGVVRKNPRVFTRKEVRNLVLGHTAFLGVAGWGLLPEGWLNEATQDLPESERVAIQQGLFAWGIYLLSDGEAKIATGSTFGSFNFYKELYADWVDKEAPWYAVLTGPGGAAVANWMGKLGYVTNIMATEGVSVESAKDALRELSTGFSSINNAHKAMLAANIDNVIRGRSGQQLYELTSAELGFEAIGISSIDKYELNNFITKEAQRKKDIKALGDEVAKHIMLALEAEKEGKKDTQKYHENVVATIMAAHRHDMNTHKALWDATIKSSKYGTRLEKLIVDDLRYNFNDKMSILEAYKDR